MNSSSLKVSVIILSFNQAEFIAEAINSVLNQTYKNLEIIISDNGSTDSTKEIIESFLSDERIIQRTNLYLLDKIKPLKNLLENL